MDMDGTWEHTFGCPVGIRGGNQLGCHVVGHISHFHCPGVAPQLIRDGSNNKKNRTKRNRK